MSEDTTAYPLCWPPGWPRTASPRRGAYQVTFERARRDLTRNLQLFGVSDIILSSNIRLRLDGNPYAGDREPEDPAVAVYFKREGVQQVMACDKWDRVKDNIRALGLAVEALRQLQRCGSTEILDRAFTGFTALPAHSSTRKPWREVLGYPDASLDRNTLEQCYRRALSAAHPDKPGGSAEAFQEVQDAYLDAQAAF